MPQTLRGLDPDRLERSCKRDSIRFASSAAGLERAEVYLSTCSFEPHRHDSFAIGMTTRGVQTFRYRGSRRVSLPLQLQILHPDETHDGSAGSDEGFGYRVLYIAPELIHDALGGSALPFVAEPVQRPNRATRRLVSVLADIDDPISDLGRAEIAAAVADSLRVLGGGREQPAVAIDTRAVELARDYLRTYAGEQIPASRLEEISGHDRFTLTRHFRLALGTSPDRYRTQRRVELARAAIESGLPLAQAAVHAGFADQSHMTRQFKRTYGLTPARWRTLTSAPGSPLAPG